jgi:excisionase family DNA binding protein
MSTDIRPRPLLTRKQVASLYGLSLRTIDSLLASAKLPHFRIGAAVRFDPIEVDSVMRKRYHVDSQTDKGHSPEFTR